MRQVLAILQRLAKRVLVQTERAPKLLQVTCIEVELQRLAGPSAVSQCMCDSYCVSGAWQSLLALP